MGKFHLVFCTALVLLLSVACSSGGELIVDLKSDLVAFHEVRSVRLEVQSTEETFSRTETRDIGTSADLLAGVRLAEMTGLPEGPALLRATLISRDGRWLLTRLVRVEIGASTAATILATRDCRDVSCEDAGAEACLGGTCGDARCTPETPEFCESVSECTADSECPALAACAMAVCQHGLCFYSPVVGACAAGEWCDPESGCRPGEAPGMDSGVPTDSSVPTDAPMFPDGCGPELCNGDDDDCDGTIDEEEDSPCAALHASARCEGGTCIAGACEAGYADCDADPANGCEVSTDTSPTDCGFCGNACTTENGVPGCSGGVCGVGSCDLGYGDCDGTPVTGCETLLADSMSHCGRCGNVCDLANGTSSCMMGTCQLGSCDSGFADCDGASSTGCEAELAFDDAHCGACGSACTLPDSTSACAASTCVVMSCDAGFDDCDFVDTNGCETNLGSDASNCGACGARCGAPNTSFRCAAGACVVLGCDAGYADCDTDPTNGCESFSPCAPQPSCAALLAANPMVPSGIYTINPDGTDYQVYCDMTIDGGGWTLVLSTRSNVSRPSDGAAPYYSDLRRLIPSSSRDAGAGMVWDGLRSVYTGNTDVRFTCAPDGPPTPYVDIVFYDVDWYRTLTSSTDEAAICFFDGTSGAGVGAPARRDIRDSRRFLSAGTAWTQGYLQAERLCASGGDFFVDFNGGGIGTSTPTRWGAINSSYFCGAAGGVNHHMWVRTATSPTM